MTFIAIIKLNIIKWKTYKMEGLVEIILENIFIIVVFQMEIANV